MLEVKKYDYIDSLRGVAILMVMIRHSAQYFPMQTTSESLDFILNLGDMGVQLFFIVSAYTLMLSTKHKKDNINWTGFYIKRVTRVLPLYFLGIIYFTWQLGGINQRTWINETYSINFITLLTNAFLMHGFSPYTINSIVPGGWSIAAEFLFYLLFPLLFFKLRNINILLSALCISLSIAIFLQIALAEINLIPEKELWSAYLSFYFPMQIPAFLIGIITYYYIVENQKTFSIWLLITALILISILAYIKNHYKFAVFVGFVFPAFVFIAEKYQNSLKHSILQYIGKVSYSMYFIHFAVLYWLVRFDFFKLLTFPKIISFTILYIVVIILTALLSTITYNLIELPFIRLGKKINSHLSNQ